MMLSTDLERLSGTPVRCGRSHQVSSPSGQGRACCPDRAAVAGGCLGRREAMNSSGRTDELLKALTVLSGLGEEFFQPELVRQASPCDLAHDLAGHDPVDSRHMGCPYDPPAQEALEPVCRQERRRRPPPGCLGFLNHWSPAPLEAGQGGTDPLQP